MCFAKLPPPLGNAKLVFKIVFWVEQHFLHTTQIQTKLHRSFTDASQCVLWKWIGLPEKHDPRPLFFGWGIFFSAELACSSSLKNTHSFMFIAVRNDWHHQPRRQTYWEEVGDNLNIQKAFQSMPEVALPIKMFPWVWIYHQVVPNAVIVGTF